MDVKAVFLFVSLLVRSLAEPNSNQDYDVGIIGGNVAAIGSAPYMVALSILLQDGTSRYHCGGSLISTRTVLTAGHCIDDKVPLSNYLGRVGSNIWLSGGQTYTFIRSVVHQNFNTKILTNDIGLLITYTEVTLSALVQRVKLTFDVIPSGVPAKLTGWGYTDRQHTATPLYLMELQTVTFNDQKCSKAYIDMDPSLKICTLSSPNSGACQGDSGSPLVLLDSSGAPAQFGILSSVALNGCAMGNPDVHTRISSYQLWLQQNVV